MVLPILDYCDIVWYESSEGKNNMVKEETQKQRSAVRIVFLSVFFFFLLVFKLDFN